LVSGSGAVDFIREGAENLARTGSRIGENFRFFLEAEESRESEDKSESGLDSEPEKSEGSRLIAKSSFGWTFIWAIMCVFFSGGRGGGRRGERGREEGGLGGRWWLEI